MSRDFASENAQLIDLVKSLYTHSASVNAAGYELEHRLGSILRIVDRLLKSSETAPKHMPELRSIEAEISESIRLAASVSQPFHFKKETSII